MRCESNCCHAGIDKQKKGGKLKKPILLAAMMFIFLMMASPVPAHFGMIIPSDSMVMQDDNRTITVTLSFSHPFEMVGMELVEPKAFHVPAGKNRTCWAH